MKALEELDLFLVRQKFPSWLVTILKNHRVYVGGGFIRATIAREEISDIDLFVPSEDAAKSVSQLLRLAKPELIERKTDNAITLYGWRWPIQIITRWVFEKPADLVASFDFTICQAAIHFVPGEHKGHWESLCSDRFYPDLAAKRLIYTSPLRKEDAGGSLLRVLKYYRRGYTIPLADMGKVVARLLSGMHGSKLADSEEGQAMVIAGLLREVDPLFDPDHIIHDPTGSEG